jgi:hypothetical protein
MVLLPDGCKVRFMHTADDVNAYAFDLKTCQCNHPDEALLVERLSGFFQDLCQRLASITGPQKAYAGDPWLSWGEVTRTIE